MARTLIVAATHAEAAHVPSGADLLVTGIGKVRATMALTRRLERGDYARVVNIGTAGALHDHHAGLFVPSVVIEHDISAAALAAIGYDTVDRWEVDGGDGTVLATGDTFVTDPEHRGMLAERADLVDMEGAAIAQVCARYRIPITLVKAVSDQADDSAMDWPQVVDAAARDLADWLRSAGVEYPIN
ncbi:nucleosidase [Gordonia sp. HY442]|uniref:nucleosidase n=1 Tax=Gordonia zhenghanii TaxID=2911516 RepID=UPI001F01D065|nr:nucleosidase [Gordonia zhenghanii]MCF8601964.1 nucleosidase [Gordonia zhenghanii]MCF8602032.1 nucleosidase [Gordonia zhenghanii]